MEGAFADLEVEIVVDDDGWIRRKSWATALGTLFAWVFALFYIALLVLGLSAVRSPGEFLERLAIGILAVGIPIVLGAVAAVRMPRAGVRISPEGVVVRGVSRNWRVDRQDAVRFVPGRQESAFAGELLRCTYGVLLERRGRRPVPIWALRSTQRTDEEGLGEGEARWQPVCDRLNELLAATTGSQPDDSLQSAAVPADPLAVARPTYEIDDQGNLVEKGAAPAPGGDAAEEVTPEAARRFLLALAFADLWGIAILVVSAFVFMPGQRTLLLAIAVVYALFSVGVFAYMRRHVYGQVKRSR